MKKIQLKLRTKITLLIIIVVLVSLFFGAFFISQWTIRNVQKEEETNIMDKAKIIASMPSIKKALNEKDPNKDIQKIVEDFLKLTETVEVIVVADMESIRYGHPKRDRLGKKFVGGDEKEVINKGKSYVSEATGTLGREIRAFTPIYYNNEQIGFVMAGTFTQTINDTKKESLIIISKGTLIGLIIGIIGAFLLATNIKHTLLGLEPEEISKLYVEKNGMLYAIHEGIIAINENEEITLVNDSAIEMLHIKEKDVLGRKVRDVFPTSKLPNVLESGKAEFDREQLINDTIIMTNRVPVKSKQEIIGAIATFRDKTKITKLAEEVTGVKQIVEALRSNTHEFMNKLHVILGLLHIEDYEHAKKFIISETKKQQQILSLVMNNIEDSAVAGLIIGKFSRAKELDINMKISKESKLSKLTGQIKSNTLITVIGNLLENSMEALLKSDKEDKNVELLIKETPEILKIIVTDNGCGIDKGSIPLVFKRGYSTKEGSRGIGLDNVKNVVENLGGNIKVESIKNVSTKFIVTIPKREWS